METAKVKRYEVLYTTHITKKRESLSLELTRLNQVAFAEQSGSSQRSHGRTAR